MPSAQVAGAGSGPFSVGLSSVIDGTPACFVAGKTHALVEAFSGKTDTGKMDGVAAALPVCLPISHSLLCVADNGGL